MACQFAKSTSSRPRIHRGNFFSAGATNNLWQLAQNCGPSEFRDWTTGREQRGQRQRMRHLSRRLAIPTVPRDECGPQRPDRRPHRRGSRPISPCVPATSLILRAANDFQGSTLRCLVNHSHGGWHRQEISFTSFVTGGDRPGHGRKGDVNGIQLGRKTRSCSASR
jgi:hypothetical protein